MDKKIIEKAISSFNIENLIVDQSTPVFGEPMSKKSFCMKFGIIQS